ncbi:hypothetical protein M409DRAFT_49158 [Zasmidium cellare ATCC 36951]|uniref:Serine hydrolase domain-containing protein n=1 Tax=Zasmidium cellare ATCC 36951 TaxID=1080233 RepID=A0A6A6D0R1_ZASCE|nr:uncharacterized protein M409DRAFT_49158 [Zasmidium cellare ATCC 36951]KAF2172603.1 hypothetical protein M409DRAFT_49158 [Zasmidium cellare ATCC 36951]
MTAGKPLIVQEHRDLSLPRILCLHGGGSNARIFKAQCRALSKQLAPFFLLVFVEGPFPSEPGPDVTSVYQRFGPYRRWVRSGPQHPEIEASEVKLEIDQAILSAMKESDRQGATGDWVALMGFSQGAKLAASLLLRHQLHATNAISSLASVRIRFAVLMAGRAPLVSLDPYTQSDPAFLDAGDFAPMDCLYESLCRCQDAHLLRLPTIHVHGLKDAGLVLHRALSAAHCSPESTTLVEWDGQHRVPIQTKDVLPVVDAILDTAQATGTLR